MKTLRLAALILICLSSLAPAVAQVDPDLPLPKLFPANERLRVFRPAGPIKLAQPFRVRLEILSGEVDSIGVTQHIDAEWFANKSNGVEVGSSTAKIVEDNGIEKTIEIVPLQLGNITFDIDVFFTDGGRAYKSFQVRAKPSSKGLTRLKLNSGSTLLALVLEEKEKDRQELLTLKAEYSTLESPIYLRNLTEIKFSVEQPEFDPVIRVDGRGLVHALRPGNAVLVADFDGVKVKIKVRVYSQDEAPSDYRYDHPRR